jgi:hypothetical protein
MKGVLSFCLDCSSRPSTKYCFSSPIQFLCPYRPASCMARQSYWVACLLISVSGENWDFRLVPSHGDKDVSQPSSYAIAIITGTSSRKTPPPPRPPPQPIDIITQNHLYSSTISSLQPASSFLLHVMFPYLRFLPFFHSSSTYFLFAPESFLFIGSFAYFVLSL